MENKTNYVTEARYLISIGISVIPVKSDGSKMPAIRWKDYQTRLMNDAEVVQHFTNCGGVIVITGKVSNLICLDFDLDKAVDPDATWKEFMGHVPVEVKERMLINKTRSGGFHIYLRTEYEDKSRKITHRPLTVPEIIKRYENFLEMGANELTASVTLLKKPVECVIETRSRGSYAVFLHPSYSRFYGKSLHPFSPSEVEDLLSVGYSMDWRYIRPKKRSGNIKDYKVLKRFNEDITAEDVVGLLEGSGMFKFYDTDSNGNFRMARVGSGNPFSLFVYHDTGVAHVFGMNPLTEEDKQTLSPFEVYCAVRDFTEEEAIEKLAEHYIKEDAV